MTNFRKQAIAHISRENMHGYPQDWINGDMTPDNMAEALWDNRNEMEEADDEMAGLTIEDYIEIIEEEFDGWIKEQEGFLIFSHKPQHVTGHVRKTSGWEFHGHVRTLQEGFEKIEGWEDDQFFPQEDGRVTDQNGDEVYSPSAPDFFDFGDWTYNLHSCADQLTDAQLKAIFE